MGVLLACLLSLFMLPAATFGLEGPSVYHRAKAATALIVAIDDAASTVSFGSGFFVGRDGLLLTNAHVVRDHTRLLVYQQNRAVDASPKVLALDSDLDLAALRVRFREGPALPLTVDVPEDGSPVVAAGYPRIIDLLKMGLVIHTSAFPMTVSGLTYGRSRTTGQPMAFLQTTGLLNAGISGGPLVHAASGRAVGMVVHSVPYLGVTKDRAGTVTGTVQLRAGMSYAIPAILIHQWLTSRNLSHLTGKVAAAVPPVDRTKATLPKSPSARDSFATAHLLHTIGNALDKEKSLIKLAIFHYDTARRQQPKDPWILRSLGRAHAALDEWNEAYEAYHLALAERPHDASLYAEIGDALFELHSFERAYKYYRQALRQGPCSAHALTGLGRTLWRTGRRADGFKSFQEAYRCAPRSAIVIYNLGLALHHNGAHDKTLQLWQGFLPRIHPTSAKEKRLVRIIRHTVTQLKDSAAPEVKHLSSSLPVRGSAGLASRPPRPQHRAGSP